MKAMGAEERFVEPIRSTRTFEAAIRHIIEGIERSRLRSGDRLPGEEELAQQLGISRPTLRQALRILERAGFVSVRRGAGGGLFMASDLVPLETISDFVSLEEEAVIEVLRGRRALETLITEVAATSATPDDFADLERTILLMDDNIGNRSAVFRADAMFHRAVARSCHNRVLEQAMGLVARELAPVRDSYQGGKSMDELAASVHREQLTAMRGADQDRLHQVLDRHFRMLEEAFCSATNRSWEEAFGSPILKRPPL